MIRTISSLQSHFLKLYTSRQRQCKLGYDSSEQCDSFQLGEMIRYFTRKGTLSLQSVMTDSADQRPYTGNTEQLLTTLQQCPTYQIDRNHTHCGLRTKLLPLLDHVRPLSQIGVCLHCWKHARRDDSWLEHQERGVWHFTNQPQLETSRNFCRDHRLFRAMYTAGERDWMG